MSSNYPINLFNDPNPISQIAQMSAIFNAPPAEKRSDEQAAQVLKKFFETDLPKLAQSAVSSMSCNLSFSEISEAYGLNVFVLAGKVDDLRRLFKEQYPDADALKPLPLADLDRYNQIGLISSSLYKEVGQELFKGLPFSELCKTHFEQVLMAMSSKGTEIGELLFSTMGASENLGKGLGLKIDASVHGSSFEYKEILDTFHKEFSNPETFFKTFEKPYTLLMILNLLNAMREGEGLEVIPFFTKEQNEATIERTKTALLEFGKDLSFTQLTESLMTRDEWKAFTPDLYNVPGESNVMIFFRVFGEDAVKAKFDREFEGLSREQILDKIGQFSQYFAPFCNWLPAAEPQHHCYGGITDKHSPE